AYAHHGCALRSAVGAAGIRKRRLEHPAVRPERALLAHRPYAPRFPPSQGRGRAAAATLQRHRAQAGPQGAADRMTISSLIRESIQKARAAMDAALADAALLEAVEEASMMCVDALRAGKKILLAGNGGSAADSQHIAAELLSRLNYDRP